jgi:hypothetical protein
VGKVTLGEVSLRVLRFFPVIIIPPWLHTYIICGMNNSPVGGRSSETSSHPIDMNNNIDMLQFCLRSDNSNAALHEHLNVFCVKWLCLKCIHVGIPGHLQRSHVTLWRVLENVTR